MAAEVIWGPLGEVVCGGLLQELLNMRAKRAIGPVGPERRHEVPSLNSWGVWGGAVSPPRGVQGRSPGKFL